LNLNSTARVLFLAFVALVALAISGHILIEVGPRDLGIDFAVFERASNDSADLVYRIDQAPFAYPPTALVLMMPLTAFGYWFWAIISGLIFAISVALVAGKRTAALAFLSPAVLKGLVQGQTSLLLGGLLFLGLRPSSLIGGSLWGVAAAIKPQLLLFAPVALVARREWKVLAGMALGATAVVLISLIILDPSLWLRWPQALMNFGNMIDHGAMTKVISPAGQAAEAGLPTIPFVIAGLGLGAAAVALAAPRIEGAQLVALITASSIVASPYAHPYDTTAIIPACIALLLNGRWIYAIPAGFIFMGTQRMTTAGLVFILIVVLVESILQRHRNDNGIVLPAAHS
jgi:hypothetical protein